MNILGFQKLTLLDYPEHIAATVFTGGCNFRCPFCHNGDLVLHPAAQAGFSHEEIFATLQKRRGMLQGVCITGGEPTLQPDLPEFIQKVKELGYKVKLDTNGYRPDVLKGLLEEGMLDYVAMDVKASLANYAVAVGLPEIDVAPVCQSIELLKSSGIPYEFRTTVVRGIHEVEEFEEVGKLLAGCRAYFLQSFRESENMVGNSVNVFFGARNTVAEYQGASETMQFSAFPKETMERIANTARKYIDRVELRGVE